MNNENKQKEYRYRLHTKADDRGRGIRVSSCFRLVLLALIVSFGIISCMKNLATGEKHINLISESSEIAMGRQADSQIVSTLGLYDDAKLQSYVQALGYKLAKNSERPNLPWTFRIVDDPVVNAFALPGGFIYVTRGLMTYVMNEAELAGVLGHEIGHVTAQHSVHTMSSQQLTQIGMAAGGMIEPKLQRYGQYLNAGLGLMYLKFSRDDENQADQLGFRYMIKAEQDPRQMIYVFNMLDRISESSGGSGTPEWLETHPSPDNRSADFQKEIDTLNIALNQLDVNQESYLNLIDGMVFGHNPRDGFFQTNHFYHPALEFDFIFPNGWQTINQRSAVVALSPNQDAVVEITQVEGTSSASAARKFFDQEGMVAERLVTGNLNGLTSVSGLFKIETEQGVLRGKASFVEFNRSVYQLLGFCTEQGWTNYQITIVNSLSSFQRLTESKILNVQPMQLKIITVNNSATLAQLSNLESSDVKLETLAIINQVMSNNIFNIGDRVKIVIGEKLDNL